MAVARLPDHWNDHARQWQWLASPLRPAPEDVAIVQDALLRWHARRSSASASALLLGVTAEIASLDWPRGVSLVAVDHSLGMIGSLWRDGARGFPAVCGDWTRLPLADRSQHVIVGDGCFSAFTYPGGYDAAVRELHRVLHRDGMLALRFFVRPQTPEPVSRVFADLRAARIGNFHVFKWRLAMALHGTLDEGVKLTDIWRVWQEYVPDPRTLAETLGWRVEVVRTIDVYRDVATRYTFPTLTEVRNTLLDAFVESQCIVPRYELGERCPTLIMTPR